MNKPLALALAAAALSLPIVRVPVVFAGDPPVSEAEKPRDVSSYNLDQKGLAIEGYDPVAYFPEGGGKAAKGKAELTLTWRSVTYRFATKENLDRFKADPARYEPAHGGWCSSAMADGGRKVEVSPRNFKVTDGRLFLFYKDMFNDALDYWNKDEPGNTKKADEQWKRLSGEDPRVPAR
jgi:YHS domain-containing protein